MRVNCMVTDIEDAVLINSSGGVELLTWGTCHSGGRNSCGPLPHGWPAASLLLLLAHLFAAAFAGQRFFHSLFLARFQVEGMTLYLFDDVFLLYLAFETS